ncbi:MAG: hypothetical protein SRB1_02336 [Desulfobacteraceae bacterium Eth-SRB1]|nr:MAG: hypothetical protein SRB1_02336 [Desulfobacteraceae bacterium Eth-SRB1]
MIRIEIISPQLVGKFLRIERWSVRTLRNKIDGMLYERTAISKKPEKLVKKKLAPFYMTWG